MDIYDQIKAERIEQDKEWGGAKHDNQHHEGQWALIVMKLFGVLSKMIIGTSSPPKTRTLRMKNQVIKIAAVCVAWLEAIERRES